MKNLLIAFILGTSMMASFSQALTIQPSQVLVEVKNVSINIRSVQFANTGFLTVVSKNGAKKSMRLAPSIQSDFNAVAEILSQADLKTVERAYVCMTIIAPFANPSLNVLSQAGLRLVLSSDACMMKTHTHPKDSAAYKVAVELKAKMIVLAKQMIQE